MKTHIIFFSLFTWMALTQTVLADIIIDNFTTGPTPRMEVNCGVKDVTKNGNMVGGKRYIRLAARERNCNLPSLYQQKATVLVRPDTGLILNEDFTLTAHSLEVFYGLVVENGQSVVTPLNLDMTEGGLPDQRIRISFAALDRVENFVISLFTIGNARNGQCNIFLNPSDTSFTIDFPLANFDAPDLTNVDWIRFLSQTGSQTDSTDLAIRSISVTSTPNPNAFVANCNGGVI